MKNSVVKESMTKGLITIAQDAPMEQAANLMEQNRIRHLLVRDSLGEVIGILSDRDVNRAFNPEVGDFPPGAVPADYMAWPVVTVDQSLPLVDVAQGMVDEKVSAFVVVNSDKSIVGIITSEDLLKYLVKIISTPTTAERLVHSPLISEFIRDIQTVGL
jgi:acetoin utilization protein AcuB